MSGSDPATIARALPPNVFRGTLRCYTVFLAGPPLFQKEVTTHGASRSWPSTMARKRDERDAWPRLVAGSASDLDRAHGQDSRVRGWHEAHVGVWIQSSHGRDGRVQCGRLVLRRCRARHKISVERRLYR